MQIAETMLRTISLLQAFTAEKAKDGDYTLDELKQTKGELEGIVSAIDYLIERYDEAFETAGGADVKGDLNKATKINLEDLDVSDVKPGQDQRKV